MLFDEFFGQIRYKDVLPLNPWAQHTVFPTTDLTVTGGVKAMMEQYVALRIGVVFPGTTFADMLNMPHQIVEWMFEIAESERGKKAREEANEDKNVQELERMAKGLKAQSK